MLFTQKHIILIHVKHRVSIYECLLFCTVSPTGVGNQRRGCLLKQDMSTGEVSWHEVCYPCTVERLVDASPFFLLLDTSLFETLFIHTCTMP